MMVVKTVWKCKYCDFLSFCNDNEYHNDGCIGYGKLINQEWVCVDSLKKELSKLMSNHIMERRGKSNISYAKALDDVEVLFGEATFMNMYEYKVSKKCKKIIDDFWRGSGYPKFGTQNYGIIDDAIIYTFRKLTEVVAPKKIKGKAK